jgi:hypothetical protein
MRRFSFPLPPRSPLCLFVAVPPLSSPPLASPSPVVATLPPLASPAAVAVVAAPRLALVTVAVVVAAPVVARVAAARRCISVVVARLVRHTSALAAKPSWSSPAVSQARRHRVVGTLPAVILALALPSATLLRARRVSYLILNLLGGGEWVGRRRRMTIFSNLRWVRWRGASASSEVPLRR